jgi:beta-phosphoglucomutase-like phosphatase (HAD superfamily)
MEINCLIESKRCVILDFDGVIADTEPLHAAAYDEVLTQLFNISLPGSRFAQRYLGRSEPEIYRLIERDFGIKIDDARFRQARRKAFLGLVDNRDLQPNPFVERLVEEQQLTGSYSLNVLSSQGLDLIKALLRRWRLEAAFGQVVSCESRQVSKGEVFRHVSEYFHCLAVDAVVFEDSPAALVAARAAGLRTVAVRHSLNAELDLVADVSIIASD